jgi:ABC-type Mn2+/Zn2+ transport system ATPase subunit
MASAVKSERPDRAAFALEISDLVFSYPSRRSDDRPVLENVSLHVRKGEIVRISGRNGSGKSTLFKIIAKELEPTSGRCHVDPRLTVVYVDQNAWAGTGEALTLREQMSLGNSGREHRRNSTTDPSPRIDLSEFDLGLEERLDDFVDHLSGGQRQIVALATVLQQGAGLILLDEFASAMDRRSANIAARMIQREVERSRVTVLFVGHWPEVMREHRNVTIGGG